MDLSSEKAENMLGTTVIHITMNACVQFSIHSINDSLVALLVFIIPSLMNNISIINTILVRGQLCHMSWL